MMSVFTPFQQSSGLSSYPFSSLQDCILTLSAVFRSVFLPFQQSLGLYSYPFSSLQDCLLTLSAAFKSYEVCFLRVSSVKSVWPYSFSSFLSTFSPIQQSFSLFVFLYLQQSLMSLFVFLYLQQSLMSICVLSNSAFVYFAIQHLCTFQFSNLQTCVFSHWNFIFN